MAIHQLGPEWTAERKWKATGRARGRYIGDLEQAIYAKWGEEGLRVIAEVYRNAAERTFLEGLRSFGIEGDDATAYAKFFVIANSILGYDMELAEATPKRAMVRIHTCHLFPKPAEVGGHLCRLANFAFERRAVELLNPKLRVSPGKLQSEGDPYCEIVVEEVDG